MHRTQRLSVGRVPTPLGFLDLRRAFRLRFTLSVAACLVVGCGAGPSDSPADGGPPGMPGVDAGGSTQGGDGATYAESGGQEGLKGDSGSDARDAGADATEEWNPPPGRTFYIDFSTGSNSNSGTSPSSPWKSHPYMQTASACTGGVTGWNGYTHRPGDWFVFKGGVSWPGACFQMTLQAGGTSSAQDDYRADPAWYAGSAFARPVFDLGGTVPASEPGGFHHDVVWGGYGGSYVTFDDIEVAHQQLALTNGTTYATTEAFGFYGSSCNLEGIAIKNVYIHDYFTNAAVGPGSTQADVGDASSGAVIGCGVTLSFSTIDTTNVYGFNATGNKIYAGFGGACENCKEVSNVTFIGGLAQCFSVFDCHDNDMSGVSQTPWDTAAPAGFGLLASPKRPHTQVIEEDSPQTQGGLVAYNNKIHDNSSAAVVMLISYNDQIYNNVMWNNSHNNISMGIPASDNPSNIGRVENNTIDCTNGSACMSVQGVSSSCGKCPLNMQGVLYVRNNHWINNGSPAPVVTLPGGTVNVTQSNNLTMSSSMAAAQGYTVASLYRAGGATVGMATNLASDCAGSGLAALCFDTEGATWFGGNSVARSAPPASWDVGAYQSPFSGGH